MLNSIYGLTASGINPKPRFDTVHERSVTSFYDSYLTSPLVASFTTSFIRAVIAEHLFYLESQKALVLSVTTDGFITDKDPSLMLSSKVPGAATKMFKENRFLLSESRDYLELKHSCIGIINITVRGQLGLSEDSTAEVKAMTGFQSKH